MQRSQFLSHTPCSTAFAAGDYRLDASARGWPALVSPPETGCCVEEGMRGPAAVSPSGGKAVTDEVCAASTPRGGRARLDRCLVSKSTSGIAENWTRVLTKAEPIPSRHSMGALARRRYRLLMQGCVRRAWSVRVEGRWLHSSAESKISCRTSDAGVMSRFIPAKQVFPCAAGIEPAPR